MSRSTPSSEPEPTQALFKLEDVLMTPEWALQRLALSLLPAPVLLWYARQKGRLLARVANKRRRLRRAMAHVLAAPEDGERVDEVCRRYLQFIEQYRLLRVMREPSRFAGSLGAIVGEEHLRQALEQGKGVILLTAHYGYDKSLAPILQSRGYQCRVLGNVEMNRHERMSRVGEFLYFRLLRLPSFYRSDTVDIPAGLNPRPLVEALKENHLVQIASDGSQSTAMTRAPGFGGDVSIAMGPYSVARSTGAALVPMFGVDAGDGSKIQALILPPLRTTDAEGKALSTQDMASQFAARYLEVAEAYPHLFEWKHLGKRLNQARKARKKQLREAAGSQ